MLITIDYDTLGEIPVAPFLIWFNFNRNMKK